MQKYLWETLTSLVLFALGAAYLVYGLPLIGSVGDLQIFPTVCLWSVGAGFMLIGTYDILRSNAAAEAAKF